MKLFISYARVDKYYSVQLAEVLSVHELWMDNRLEAGKTWWDEILRQLEWCEGFVYMLSPDSVASTYCRQEYEIAKSLGKHIFPILIHARTQLTDDLADMHYVDLSSGITVDAVKLILDSIYLADRSRQLVPIPEIFVPGGDLPPDQPTSPQDAEYLVQEAIEAFDAEQYDRAVYLLKQAKASGYESFIDLDSLLHVAEDELEWQARGREMEREYEPIAALVKHEGTRKWGCDAFRKFHQVYPNYDPENLAEYCLTLDSPLFEWCDIPGGEIRFTRGGAIRVLKIESYQIGKYPVTAAQFQEFVEAPDGYRDEHWWGFSGDALAWRKAHPESVKTKVAVHDHPSVNVCWYEAVAFCRWYSSRTGDTIVLPTEIQWQWAAQGNDGRIYPWGNVFESTRCNTREGKMMRTMPVTYHVSGASPYGVLDMAGNVWEWCANTEDRVLSVSLAGDAKRTVKGGCFLGGADRATCKFRFSLNPESRYQSIGFRLVRLNH